MPIVMALGGFCAAVQSTFYFTGNRLDGYQSEHEDEFEHKEIIRRTTRVPIEQTVAEIGEGRGKFALGRHAVVRWLTWIGIRPPGYEERRRERIKEKYGFEVDPVTATVAGSQ